MANTAKLQPHSALWQFEPQFGRKSSSWAILQDCTCTHLFDDFLLIHFSDKAQILTGFFPMIEWRSLAATHLHCNETDADHSPGHVLTCSYILSSLPIAIHSHIWMYLIPATVIMHVFGHCSFMHFFVLNLHQNPSRDLNCSTEWLTGYWSIENKSRKQLSNSSPTIRALHAWGKYYTKPFAK